MWKWISALPEIQFVAIFLIAASVWLFTAEILMPAFWPDQATLNTARFVMDLGIILGTAIGLYRLARRRVRGRLAQLREHEGDRTALKQSEQRFQ